MKDKTFSKSAETRSWSQEDLEVNHKKRLRKLRVAFGSNKMTHTGTSDKSVGEKRKSA